MRKRALSLMLVILMLLSSVVSCSEAPADDHPEDTAPVSSDTPASPTETEAETEYSILNTLPEYSFGGDTITTLTRDDVWWQITMLDAEGMTGETINDAIYDRNVKFETLYEADFEVVYGQVSLADTVRTAVTAGDDTFDFVVPSLTDAAPLAIEDQLINLHNIETIDFTNEAWDHNAVDCYSVAHKLYYGVSDISLGKNETAWIYLFNKNLVTEFGLENPYELVREKKWTMGKSLEMGAAASNDTNGNGKADWKEDQIGLATHNGNHYALLISAGLTVAVKDENDLPVLNLESERFVEVYDFIKDNFMASPEICIGNDQSLVFPEGRNLFCGQVLGCVRLWREMEDDLGIIPTPMFNEDQSQYYTFVMPYNVYASCIPTSAADPERSGTAIQALAILSAHYLTPAYYDITITGKGLRDEESIEMLDLILDSAVYDLALVYNWGGYPRGLNASLEKGQPFTSGYKRKAKSINAEVQKTIDAFLTNKN